MFHLCDHTLGIVAGGIRSLPCHVGKKIPASEHLIHDNFQVMPFVVVTAYPDASILAQKIAQEFKTRVHHGQPPRMLQIVVVMFKGASGVVRRVYVNALHLARIVRQQGFEGVQVVALNEHVPGAAVAMAPGFFQQAVGRASGGAKILVTGKPLQNGHG